MELGGLRPGSPAALPGPRIRQGGDREQFLSEERLNTLRLCPFQSCFPGGWEDPLRDSFECWSAPGTVDHDLGQGLVFSADYRAFVTLTPPCPSPRDPTGVSPPTNSSPDSKRTHC